MCLRLLLILVGFQKEHAQGRGRPYGEAGMT